MRELLFHTPWWLPALFLGIGAALFWSGNARQETRVRTAGLVCVLLGVAIMVVSYLVDTPIEKAVKGSKALVRSVEQRDWTTLNSTLSPRTSLTVLNSITLYNSGPKIVDAAKRAVEQYGLKNVYITSTEAQQADTVITVTMEVLSEQDISQGRPIPST